MPTTVTELGSAAECRAFALFYYHSSKIEMHTEGRKENIKHLDF